MCDVTLICQPSVNNPNRPFEKIKIDKPIKIKCLGILENNRYS